MDKIELANTAVGKTLDIAKTAVANQFVGLILGVALVEYLQTVEIPYGKPIGYYDYERTGQPVWVYRRLTRPLISQGLATTLESAGIIESALKAFDLSTLLPILRGVS